MSEPFFLFTSLFDLREAFLLTLLLIGGQHFDHSRIYLFNHIIASTIEGVLFSVLSCTL